jgi:hypothetical protein
MPDFAASAMTSLVNLGPPFRAFRSHPVISRRRAGRGPVMLERTRGAEAVGFTRTGESSFSIMVSSHWQCVVEFISMAQRRLASIIHREIASTSPLAVPADGAGTRLLNFPGGDAEP